MTAAFLRVGKQKVRHILWTCGGVLRNSEGLSQGLACLGALARRVVELPTSYFPQQQKKRRLMQLVFLAELVLQSALRHAESRGCRIRTDFPPIAFLYIMEYVA